MKTPQQIRNEVEKEIEYLKNEKYSHIKDWSDETIELAIQLHNSYEVISKEENWVTQKSTHLKAFRDLPMENQRVMLRIADMVLSMMKKNKLSILTEYDKSIKEMIEIYITKWKALNKSKFRTVDIDAVLNEFEGLLSKIGDNSEVEK